MIVLLATDNSFARYSTLKPFSHTKKKKSAKKVGHVPEKCSPELNNAFHPEVKCAPCSHKQGESLGSYGGWWKLLFCEWEG